MLGETLSSCGSNVGPQRGQDPLKWSCQRRLTHRSVASVTLSASQSLRRFIFGPRWLLHLRHWPATSGISCLESRLLRLNWYREAKDAPSNQRHGQGRSLPRAPHYRASEHSSGALHCSSRHASHGTPTLRENTTALKKRVKRPQWRQNGANPANHLARIFSRRMSGKAVHRRLASQQN